MGIMQKIRSFFHDDICKQCQNQMEEKKRQLYILPITVGHYQEHKDVEYYKQNLRKVNCKADIPSGMYACGLVVYECPECGHRLVKLSIFLPVRDQEKYEDTVWFQNGEMDDFVNRI